jgi:thiol-disulfide isomerase/thioredoxin
VYTDRVKSRVVVALVALAAALLPGRMAPAEDPVAALSLIRPKPVKDAPDFQVRTPDDRSLRLAELKGKVVFLNFWATWCEPCREEMPDLVRFYRDNRAQGLRLVLISADDDAQRAEVARVLTALSFDGPAFIKRGNDMTFIDALDPRWKGALPATFLFDGRGVKKTSWLGSVTYDQLHTRVSGLLRRKKR